jgi:hypothetical protein
MCRQGQSRRAGCGTRPKEPRAHGRSQSQQSSIDAAGEAGHEPGAGVRVGGEVSTLARAYPAHHQAHVLPAPRGAQAARLRVLHVLRQPVQVAGPGGRCDDEGTVCQATATRLADERDRVAVGAARELCYMHHECSQPIVHWDDVKFSNILLDSELNAKVADFGLARMLA